MSWLRRRRLGIVPGWDQAAGALPNALPVAVQLAIRLEDVAVLLERHLHDQGDRPAQLRNVEMVDALLELRTALGPSAVPGSAALNAGPRFTDTAPTPLPQRRPR